MNKKGSWLGYIALCLLLSCSLQQGATISLDPAIVSQQGTTGQAGDVDTPLHKAILAQKDLAFIQALLKDTSIDTPGNQGNTSLHLAVRQGSLALIEILLASKADVGVKNTAGMTALHIAAQEGSLPVMELLIGQEAAGINVQDNGGYTPLFYAIREGHLALVQFLLQKGAAIGAVDVQEASRMGSALIMQLLIDSKADIEATNREGYAGLHLAASKGHAAAIQLLIDNKQL
jgi:ankyrin repeat protein